MSERERLSILELPPGDWFGLQRRYLLYLPPEYESSGQRWPLLLFLHGSGERGDDPRAVQIYGILKRLAEGEDLPFIVVAPQCPAEQRWSASSLASLLDEVERHWQVDCDRISVTGLSMGGAGAWALAMLQPDRFAALAPVCGRGEPKSVAAIAHLPVWAFHGALDDVVPLQRSEEMVEALRRAGGTVRFTVYPDAGHDSWTQAYAEPELYPWFQAQRRHRATP
jgi:predicted peptidase